MRHLRNSVICALGLFMLLAAGCKKQSVDLRASVQFNSTPEGASIFLGDRELGKTPCNGKLPAGTYIFKFVKTNHQPAWEKLSCEKSDSKTIEAKLIPITASVMLRSAPSGAKVEIDGNIVGETPLILNEQSIDKHSAILKKPGFVPQEISWTVENARPQLVQVQLGTNVGTLKVSSVPAQASISIDGKPQGETPFSDKIEQGQHQLKIEKPGYSPYEKVILVTKEQITDIKADLQILPSSIAITSNPPGASVFINNRQYENTPTEIKNLQPGNYVIKLEKAGCDPASRELTLPPGQRLEVALNLDSNTGGIDLVANPPGVTIYVDGKKVGVSEQGASKRISKMISLRNLSAEEHLIVISHKRAIPEKKEIRVKVEKGKISRPKSIDMWIADTELRHKDGRVMMGRLSMENENEVIFEPEPGIKQSYQRSEIKLLKPLAYDDL